MAAISLKCVSHNPGLAPASRVKYSGTIYPIHRLHLSKAAVFSFRNTLQVSYGTGKRRGRFLSRIAASASGHHPIPASWWRQYVKLEYTNPPCLSDILWPSAGAFTAMAVMGLVDQMLAPRGLTFTIAPFGAVCVLLFTAPNAAASKKYNVLMAHTGCALIGVWAFALFGAGWMARSVALATSVAFMLYTNSIHPPAAGLPLLFIDAPKFHCLKWWYTLFPGVIGCLFLFLLQIGVEYLKEKYRF